MFDWIADLFKAMFDLIPKIMYLLYSSIACILDALQLFFRKLAGLDVVWMEDPITGDLVMSSGDIVTQFITGILGINANGFEYSALSTVFWSMLVFGIIICFAATLVAVIKSHYTYDEKAAKGPMQYVYTAGKAIINIVAVPAIIVLGLYVSQALLTALDSITSTSSDAIIQLYGQDAVTNNLQQAATSRSQAEDTTNPNEKTYVYYDILGYGSGIVYSVRSGLDDISPTDLVNVASTQMSFSGVLFKTAAYNASRARNRNWYSSNSGKIPGYDWDGGGNGNFTLFKNAKGDNNLADMIDTAFACNLHMKHGVTITLNYANNTDSILAWVSTSYFTNFLAFGAKAFSKFNVGLVWYFYDLWQFNFIAGFGACAVSLSIFINVILGLISRLFMSLVLFLIAPPLFGLAPLDGGQAAKNWREQFMKQILMTYGAIVGMNLVLLLLPYFNQIHFFNIGIADYLAQTLIIIAGLVTMKAVIATVSAIIGAADANKTGEDMKQDVAEGLGKGILATAGAAKLGMKAQGALNKLEGKAVDKLKGGDHPFLAHALGGGVGGMLQRGMSKVGTKISGTKFGSKVSGFAKKLIKGKDHETLQDTNVMENSEKVLSEMNVDEALRNGTFNSDMQDLAKLKLQQAGMSESEANDFVTSMTKNTTLDAARADFAAGAGAKTAYGRMSKVGAIDSSGAVNKNKLESVKIRAQTTQAKHAAKVKGWKETAFTPIKIFDNMFKGDKFYDAFLDKSNIRKPTDHAKRTAEATEAMLQEMQQNRLAEQQYQDARNEIERSRWEETQAHYADTTSGFSNVVAEQKSTHADMNAGFGNVVSEQQSTNRRITNQTRSMNKNANQAHTDAEQIKNRQSATTRAVNKINKKI